MVKTTILKNRNIITIELNSLLMLSRLFDSSEDEAEKRRTLQIAQRTAKTLGELLDCKLYCKVSNHTLFIMKALSTFSYGTVEAIEDEAVVFFHELWGTKGGDVDSLILSCS